MKSTPDQSPTADDPRVVRAAQEYLAELEAGRRPNRKSFVARFPEIAAQLAPYLDALDMVHSAAPLLQEPEINHASSSTHEPPPAEPLGDFRIVGEIGRGGMGVVYEAVQMSLGRRVALKVLPFAATLDPRQRQRFQHEAEAAAGLHHSNIVPVYAVGCERGLHFYAMQLIEGRPLDAVIRELRAENGRGDVDSVADTKNLRAGPTVGRSTASGHAPRTYRSRERFRNAAHLAAQVADALEYAHNAGVIHRDIKPANLLLDAKGNVWITDFGLAQVSADVSLTRTGDLLGTIRYMSPEQAAGRHFQVDQRSDVYSLGATLYELLTLEPVFAGENRETLLQQVLHEDPLPPRRVDRSIPIELETIVLKALSKSPADRYATAGALAADLRRFLDERPILARRPSLVDRSRKWMRRHPSIVGAALLLVVLGFIGFAVSTVLIANEEDHTKKALQRLAQEQDNTKAAWTSEQERATQAEQRFKLAKGSVDEMIRIAKEAGNDNPAEQFLRRRLLETALDYYKEFINQRRDDPNAQAELQNTRDQVKTILDELETLQKSWQHLLLGEPSVLDDLKLNKEQRERVSEIVKEIGGPPDQAGDMRRPKPGFSPRTKPLVDEIKGHETAIRQILSANQLSRLRQIALQVRGPMAFHEPEVVSALELTAEQKNEIRFIEGESHPGGRGGPHPGAPPHPGNPPRRDHESQRFAVERILSLLTNKQREQWKALIGAPFKGTISFFDPPGGGGPGGPGGPGGFDGPGDGPGPGGGGPGGIGRPGDGRGGPGDPGGGGPGGQGGRGQGHDGGRGGPEDL